MEQRFGEIHKICECDGCGKRFTTKGLVCPWYCSPTCPGDDDDDEYDDDDGDYGEFGDD